MKILSTVDIVGLGALGTMYAFDFTRALGRENVRVLADAARTDRYRREGVTFNGEPCDLSFCDAASETRPAQLILYAVKYGALAQAMEETAHLIGPDTVILSVLNGIRSEEDLAARFGADKIVYCIARKMDAGKEGSRAVCKNHGELALGVRDGGTEENLRAVVDLFERIGFPYALPEDIRRDMWSKLLCNVGVNQTCSLLEGGYGLVHRPGPARDMMQAAMREVVAVANAEGIGLSEQDVTEWTATIDGLNPDGEPSMRQDSKAGRPTEVQLFAGTVCALGRKHGIPTPVNDVFLEKLH
ncbi:MAG: ketopantoate reductase family protein [Oscillospiraceae bacterium]|nr:ketopantoate reductase family protein [Oscillospiraceae bacterium]